MATNDAPRNPSKRIYIGNMPYQAQPDDVQQCLSNAGIEIERIDTSIDPFTVCACPRPVISSVLLIHLTGTKSILLLRRTALPRRRHDAISILAGTPFQGRPLKVNVHTPKRSRPSTGRIIPQQAQGQRRELASSLPRSAVSNWRREPDSATNTRNTTAPSVNQDSQPYAPDRWRRYDTKQQWYDPPAQGRRLYVGGLPRIDGQGLVDELMRKLFTGYTVQAVSKPISPHDPHEHSKGSKEYHCFVDFATPEEAAKAMHQINGMPTEWGGRYRVHVEGDKYRKVIREQGLPY